MTSPYEPDEDLTTIRVDQFLAHPPAKVWRALTEPQRMLRVRWADARVARNPADWTITRTLEPEGRGTRLFLVHEGFDPDDPARMMAHKIMGGGRRSQVLQALRETLDTLKP